ncbi:guanine nucleotide-binding protein subunit alpha [Sporobolomyces koalae]|uniref:guanine nucleotide-binding protein subunit alpha n=1 Tax=Sporobolomyces koalae TaxID=500713 RepID=UPI003175F78A
MGCNHSIEGANEGANQTSLLIDAELKKSKRELDKIVKTLLLGPGESGKSTILKQLRLAYSSSWSHEERLAFKEIVVSTTLQSMQTVLEGFSAVEIALPPELHDAAAVIDSLSVSDAIDPSTESFSVEVAQAITKLWDHPATKTVVDKRSKFQLNDSASYFFDSLARTSTNTYLPSDEDILRCRVRSTGIVEEWFVIHRTKLLVIDVGGQRSERRKWVCCFEGVQVLIFVAAISELDQTLYEDNTYPRLAESLELWGSIAHSPWFVRSNIILFLNKVDLLEQKIRTNPTMIETCLPDYTGRPDDIHAIKHHLLSRFESAGSRRGRPIFTHFTCATDTTMMRPVLRAVMESVITSLLSESGFL